MIRRSADDLRRIAERAAKDLELASAEEILAWAAHEFRGFVVSTQSMTKTTVATMIHELGLEIPAIFIDTGFHFVETLQTRDALLRSGQSVVTVASEMSLEEQVRVHGPDLWSRDPDLCCAIRKVRPLDDCLAGMEAWVTGLRRSQSDTRQQVQPVSFDEGRGIVKISPLCSWSDEQVDAYGREHPVIVNPLVAVGYPSIGCWPCTRAIEETTEHARAGRWDGFDKTECGLHDLAN